MTSERSVVVSGVDARQPALQQLASELELQLIPVAERFAEARKRLEGAPPLCLLVDCNTAIGREAALGIRMSAALVDTPVVAAIADPWSHELSETFAMGIDDYLPRGELAALRAKLAALLSPGAPAAMHLSGKVVLADPDRDRRVHLSRHLRKMGLLVDFAVDGVGIPSDTAVKLIVANSGLPPNGAARCLEEFRRGPGEKIPWVIVGQQAELEVARAALKEQPAVAFFDGEADATGIVFTANKAMAGAARTMRRSPRLIYEAAVTFQVGGAGPREWGISYNLNRGGLYIRTLTPPALGLELQLELVPPHGRGHVIVDGRVVWRQEYSGSKGYPPGIGVEYLATQPVADAAAIDAGYTKLLEDNGNPDA